MLQQNNNWVKTPLKQTRTLTVVTVMIAVAFFIMFCSLSVVAATSKSSGDYTVHYSAFTSDALQPAVAKAYGITRSKNRGLLSISILKKSLSPLGTPVKGVVKAKANNLTGQMKNIKMREIDDSGAVYYVSEFHVAHEEILDFTIEAMPVGETSPVVIKFRQQFYTQ